MSERKGTHIVPYRVPWSTGVAGPSSYPATSYSNIPTHPQGRYHEGSRTPQKVPEFCVELGKNANSRSLALETDSVDLDGAQEWAF